MSGSERRPKRSRRDGERTDLRARACPPSASCCANNAYTGVFQCLLTGACGGMSGSERRPKRSRRDGERTDLRARACPPSASCCASSAYTGVFQCLLTGACGGMSGSERRPKRSRRDGERTDLRARACPPSASCCASSAYTGVFQCLLTGACGGMSGSERRPKRSRRDGERTDLRARACPPSASCCANNAYNPLNASQPPWLSAADA
ncbi:hypothetical protein O0L34_g4348 [Tuta absoluta]|nr:hypothetical protein O0L34_g4348 [Tuta absoluta]